MIPCRNFKDADDAGDIVLLTNTPTEAEFLWHNQEQGASGIGLHVNADKTEYMHFKKKGDISTLNGGSQKLVNKFTYLGSSVSSTENEISMRLAKTWTAIEVIDYMEVRFIR